MTHDQIVAEIQRRAGARHILTHYCRDSRICDGDRGLPDLVLAGPHGVAWLEVKTHYDRLSTHQTTWKHMLLGTGQFCMTVYEGDLASGVVDGILDRLAGIPG